MGDARSIRRALGLLLLLAAERVAALPVAQPLVIGKYQSRALWTPADTGAAAAPVVILISGTGPNGPEGIVRADLTADGKVHALLSELSEALHHAGLHTLALGKPGVDFYPGDSGNGSWYYDYPLFAALHWSDLVANLAEAVHFVRTLPNVDPRRIYVLGHSQGTQVAVDYAASDPSVAGLILLGYSGDDMATLVDWQFFRRTLETLVLTDVDADHDGVVTRQEAARWSDLTLPFDPQHEQLTYAEIERGLRSEPHLTAMAQSMADWPLYVAGIYARGPLYEKTAALPLPLYVFTGALDVWTPPRDALRLLAACAVAGKTDCDVHILPGLGHGFSPPMGARHQPLLDSSFGPADPGFLDLLQQLGRALHNKQS
jgi:uncharacterized protein